MMLTTQVQGLTFACPFSQGNPDDCQLCSVRKMPPFDRLAWVESLSDHELRRILRVHHGCLSLKESWRSTLHPSLA